VISPLLANIYLNKLDRIGGAVWPAGVLVRYATIWWPCAAPSRGPGKRFGGSGGDEPARFDTASGEDAVGGLATREGELRVSGMHDSQEAEHPAKPPPALHAAVAEPKATKKLGNGARVDSKRHSGKDVKRIIAELTPVLRGWGNYFGRECDRSSTRWTALW